MKVIYIIFFFFFVSVIHSHGKDLYTDKQAEKFTKSALRDNTIFLKQRIELRDTFDKAEEILAYLFGNKGEEEFYVIITQAKGRYDLFDYLVVFNMNFEVNKVHVIKYRSEHGGEIASKKWLQQFIGYSAGDLTYKKDISAISGATISATSITDDIQRVTKILKTSSKVE